MTSDRYAEKAAELMKAMPWIICQYDSPSATKIILAQALKEFYMKGYNDERYGKEAF